MKVKKKKIRQEYHILTKRLLLEYLLCGILIKRCASDGAMQFLHLLLFPMV